MSDLSPEARAILEAARHEAAPTDEDRARVHRALTAALGMPLLTSAPVPKLPALPSGSVLSSVVKAVVVAALAAAGAGGVVVWSKPQAPVVPRPVPAAAAAASAPAAVLPAPPPAPVPTVVLEERAPALVPVAPSQALRFHPVQQPSPVFAPLDLREPTPTPPAAATAADGTLAEELRLVRQAQVLARSGDAAGALALLEEHGRRFPGGALREERGAARVQALCALNRIAEAREEADHFLAANPESPYAGRVRASCASQR